MTKRNLAALLLVSIAALTQTGTSEAQGTFASGDGCAFLADIVYAEVTAAAWYGAGGSRPLHEEARERQITVCNQTTRTVSTAFTSAMISIGEPVRWERMPIDPGDFCLSVYLDQCYPNRSRLGTVGDTWSAVKKIVTQAMPNGIATDQAIFSVGTMRSALRFALDERTDGTIATYQRLLTGPNSQMR